MTVVGQAVLWIVLCLVLLSLARLLRKTKGSAAGPRLGSDASREEILRAYDRIAPWYDLLEGLPEILGLARLRRRLLAHASGRVLEVAAGTGRNLAKYPAGCSIDAVDLSARMLRRARARARRLGLPVAFAVMDAERLAFPDGSFDTVVSSLTLCTFPDPVAALREMARVCRHGGRLLLLEHGRSDRPWLGRWQDRGADRHARTVGCRWNREPQTLVRGAGLGITGAERRFFGIFHLIEAAPAERPVAPGGRGAATGSRPGHDSGGER